MFHRVALRKCKLSFGLDVGSLSRNCGLGVMFFDGPIVSNQ